MYGESLEKKKWGSDLCHTVKMLVNVQIKRIHFMGRDGKQKVEAFVELSVWASSFGP